MKQRIFITNESDRISVAAILIKHGYTVRIGSESEGNRKKSFVEFWKE